MVFKCCIKTLLTPSSDFTVQRGDLTHLFVCVGGLMGPVRMISSGHELTTDYDEKTLHELGFKDMQVKKKKRTHTHYSSVWNISTRRLSVCLSQMVFVSLGAPRRERKGEGVQLPASCLPPPQKEHIPMLLLLQEPHLTTLFDLLEMLACFKAPGPEPSERMQHTTQVTGTRTHTHLRHGHYIRSLHRVHHSV